LQTIVENDLLYFIERTKENLNIIEQEILNLAEVEPQRERVIKIFRLAHSIKEGAAFVGIDCVCKAFHYLEDALEMMLESQIEVDRQSPLHRRKTTVPAVTGVPRLISLFLRSYDILSFLITRFENYNTLDDDKLFRIMTVTKTYFDRLFDCLKQKVVRTN